MYSGKDLAELSGYTSRVYSLLASLHSLEKGVYPAVPQPEIQLSSEVRSQWS